MGRASKLSSCLPLQTSKLFRRNKSRKDCPRSASDFLNFPPPAPQVILSQSAEYYQWLRMRNQTLPRGEEEDRPLYCLYRLYECLLLEYVTGYRNEIEYFWSQRDWAVGQIPDPQDPNASRYAFLACVPELLVLAFNKRIGLGLPRDALPIMTREQVNEYLARPESSKTYEKAPTWAERVPPLDETLVVPTHYGPALHGVDDDRADDIFKTKNICVYPAHIHFM